MKDNKKIQIAIVIDENNTTNIEIHPNEDIDNIVNNLGEKYNLKENIKIKLKEFINIYIESTVKNVEKEVMRKSRMMNDSVQRLYYKAKEKSKKKQDFIKNIKTEELNNNLNECSFKPKINFINKFNENKVIKIEEKLHTAGQTYKERNQLKRMINDIKSRNQEENLTKSKSSNFLKTSIQIKENNEFKFTLGSGMTNANDKSILSNNNYNLKSTLNMNVSNQGKIDLNFKDDPSNSPINHFIVASPGKYSMNFLSTRNKNFQNELEKETKMKAEAISDDVNKTRNIKNFFNKQSETEIKQSNLTSTKVRAVDNLYNKAILKKEKQKERFNMIQRIECPFSPQINKKSKIMMGTFQETREEFVDRMAYPPKKEIKEKSSSETNFIKKSSTQIEEKTSDQINFNSDDKTSTNQLLNDQIIVKSNIIRSCKYSLKPKYYITNKKVADSYLIPSLIKKIENKQKKEVHLKLNLTNKTEQNLNKFKLNNLKEIFELINKNCSSIEEMDNLDNYGISNQTEQKLIIPTFEIMKKRNLQFNFQYFYLIANEIMNYILSSKS